MSGNSTTAIPKTEKLDASRGGGNSRMFLITIVRRRQCNEAVFFQGVEDTAQYCPSLKPLALTQGCCQYHRRRKIEGHSICDGGLIQKGDPDECCPSQGYLKINNSSKIIKDYPGLNRTSKYQEVL